MTRVPLTMQHLLDSLEVLDETLPAGSVARGVVDGAFVHHGGIKGILADRERLLAVDLAVEAVLGLVQEPLGDHTYRIRETELKGWAGPRVTRWSQASVLAERAAHALGWDGIYTFQRKEEDS